MDREQTPAGANSSSLRSILAVLTPLALGICQEASEKIPYAVSQAPGHRMLCLRNPTALSSQAF